MNINVINNSCYKYDIGNTHLVFFKADAFRDAKKSFWLHAIWSINKQ